MNDSEAADILTRKGWSDADISRMLRSGYDDHQAFCKRLKIRDKRGILRVPDWSPSWAKLTAAIDKQQRKSRPVRGIILKGRQVHFSAGCCTHMLKRCAFLAGQHGRIFCDLHKNAANLYGYIKTYTDHYDGSGGIGTLGAPQYRQDEKITWPRGSWIEFGSAERATGGRSASVRHLIGDEFAFWRDAEQLMTGLLNSIPDDPDTMVLLPSTANGAGGPFFERWQNYSDPGYTGEWFALFFAWWEHPENAMEVPDMRCFQDSISRDEDALRKQLNLSLEQLYWRRWAIANKCEGSIEKFHQEHPSTPEEAFLTSGRPRFCHISLGRMPVAQDPLRGVLERVMVGTSERLVFTPSQDGRGELTIFRRPERDKLYVIGADPAEGVDVNEGKGTSDPDYTDIYVAEQGTGDQVACFHARLEPDPAADALYNLGEWYNWAYVVPEVNSVGLAFVQAILYRRYPVHLLYHRDRDPDDRRPAMLQELGWKESVLTRQQLISLHDRAIRELSITIRCPHCLAQHRTFIVRADGRAEHQQGCHDDAVFAGALCSVGLMTAPRIRALVEARKSKPVDFDDDEDEPQVGRRLVRRYTVRR